jgi:Uma2 family endonuclease
MELEYPMPPKASLPTMYDLPSEEIGQPGMPDLFHEWQARLLDETFHPPGLMREEFFSAIDMNLYYDVHYHHRYKRPDWFAVVGLPPEQHPGMRMSYVQWQEAAKPLVVVELLSPSTQKDDLGQLLRDVDGSPTKWDVYEQWLQVPYYVTFDGKKNDLRIFRLQGARFEDAPLENGVLWLEEARLGIGLWHGSYLGEERVWLRWCDSAGDWIPTAAERAEQERERAEQEHERAEQERERAEQERERAEQERLQKEAALDLNQKLVEKLRALGIDPDSV